jgi:hypothetical protein
MERAHVVSRVRGKPSRQALPTMPPRKKNDHILEAKTLLFCRLPAIDFSALFHSPNLIRL